MTLSFFSFFSWLAFFKIIIVPLLEYTPYGPMEHMSQYEAFAFLRELTIPEEDRFKYISQPWTGEYRWFRSPNVVCLEHYRRRKSLSANDAAPAA
jgi:hypothetical protein